MGSLLFSSLPLSFSLSMKLRLEIFPTIFQPITVWLPYTAGGALSTQWVHSKDPGSASWTSSPYLSFS